MANRFMEATRVHVVLGGGRVRNLSGTPTLTAALLDKLVADCVTKVAFSKYGPLIPVERAHDYCVHWYVTDVRTGKDLAQRFSNPADAHDARSQQDEPRHYTVTERA